MSLFPAKRGIAGGGTPSVYKSNYISDSLSPKWTGKLPFRRCCQPLVKMVKLGNQPMKIIVENPGLLTSHNFHSKWSVTFSRLEPPDLLWSHPLYWNLSEVVLTCVRAQFFQKTRRFTGWKNAVHRGLEVGFVGELCPGSRCHHQKMVNFLWKMINLY